MTFIAGERRTVKEKGVNDAVFGKPGFPLMIVM